MSSWTLQANQSNALLGLAAYATQDAVIGRRHARAVALWKAYAWAYFDTLASSYSALPTFVYDADCRDRSAPRSTITRRTLRATRTGISVRGRSADRGCGVRRVARVRVALAREVPRGCRWLLANGRFGARRSCRRPVFLRASGRERWSFSRRVGLPRGRYELEVRATDVVGNVESRGRRARVSQSFRVR